MLTKKDIIPNSNYSEDTILAKENYFKPFIIEALSEVTSLSNNYKVMKENNNSDGRELKNLKKDLTSTLELINTLLMKAYYFLKSDHKNKLHVYFKVSPSNANGNFKKTIKESEKLLQKIKNDTNNELNDFELPLVNKLKELKAIDKEIHNKSTDIKFNNNKENNLLNEWKVKYSTLKDYIKGFLRGKGIDYRIFFLDLQKKRSSTSEENTKTVSTVDISLKVDDKNETSK